MELVFAKESVNHGNDCTVCRVYLIFKWGIKYICKMFEAYYGWMGERKNEYTFNASNDEWFDTFENAHSTVINEMRMRGDYEE